MDPRSILGLPENSSFDSSASAVWVFGTKCVSSSHKQLCNTPAERHNATAAIYLLSRGQSCPIESTPRRRILLWSHQVLREFDSMSFAAAIEMPKHRNASLKLCQRPLCILSSRFSFSIHPLPMTNPIMMTLQKQSRPSRIIGW
jgi:hypothetical protein